MRQYACGGWIQRNPVPDDKSRFSAFSLLAETNDLVLRRLLDTVTASPTIPAATAGAKAAAYYSSCMDEAAIEVSGVSPLVNLVAQTLGDDSSLAVKLGRLAPLGVYPFLGAYVGADDKDSASNIVFATQSGLSLPSRGYYVNESSSASVGQLLDAATDTKLVALRDHIARTLSLMFPGEAAAGHVDEAKGIVALEAQIALAFANKTALRDPIASYNKVTVAELVNLTDSNRGDSNFFSWPDFLAALYGTDAATTVPAIVVSSPSYLASFGQILRSTPSAEISSYLRWRLVGAYYRHLSSALVKEGLSFSKAIYGVESLPPRWKTCLSRTDGAMGFALGKLFVDHEFSGSSKDSALAMIAHIKAAFENGLESLPWMRDATTRGKAREKAEAVRQKIGYPEDLSTDPQLDKYYALLQVNPGNYFAGVVSSNRFDDARNVARLGQPVDKTEWHMSPPTVNAYYSPSNNEIVFPAGILQPPFYKSDFPQAINYGGIGVVIGHELTHGFDDQGSKYDKDGNLTPLWGADVTAAFKAKTACIADQYAKFAVNGEHVNGELTLGENIADNGGLVQAFAAYRAWVDQNREGQEESRLPGLSSHSPNQLFFLSFAGVWCGAARPKEAHRLLLTDPHSPGRFRVVGTLQNSPDFAREFGCAAGSPMNPPEKCRVW